MRKWVITIILSLSVGFLLMIGNVKAISSEVYDMSSWIDISEFTLPYDINLDTNYVVIFQRSNGSFYRLLSWPKSINFYGVTFMGSNYVFPYLNSFNLGSSSSTNYVVNYYDTSSSNSKVFNSNPTGSTSGGFTAYKIIYSNVNIYHNKSGSSYSDLDRVWFDLSLVSDDLPSPELRISDTHDSTNHNATITVDTSDFASGDYKYKWGYDQMAMAMHEIVSGSNGFTLTVPYNDTIYFAVLNQDDTLVYETTYTINYDDMPNQYALHFHSYTSWGVNDIVKFVNDNTDYTDLDNFWEAGEKYIFFYGYQRRVALGFYADSSFNNELSLDGSVEFDHDAEIYVKWSTKIPDYQVRVYADDDTIRFNFQVTEWLEESRNYQILFHQDLKNVNYTMVWGSRQDGYTTPVDYEEKITIRVIYSENGETVTVWTDEIPIYAWVELYASEEEQDAINLIVEAANVNDHIDAWKVLQDFMNLIRIPIDFIIGIISYLFSKLNLHTRVFLISIFVAEMIAAIAKLMFKR